MKDRTVDVHDLDYTLGYRAESLLHARDLVGFAHVSEENQSHTPIEVTMDLFDVPLTTLNDSLDANQLHGLDDMTVVDYNDAMREVDYRLIDAIDNEPEFQKAIGECSLGQLFLIMQEIKSNVDHRNGKD